MGLTEWDVESDVVQSIRRKLEKPVFKEVLITTVRITDHVCCLVMRFPAKLKLCAYP